MSNRDNLSKIVEKAIEEHRLDTFARYWNLYEDTVAISDIQQFYVRIEPNLNSSGGYFNAAIIGDGMLVDVEGDDEQRSGSLVVHALDSVYGVSVHSGTLPGIPNTQNATMIVLAYQPGVNDIGFHWFAKTDEDEERLVQFAKVLVGSVASRP